TANLVQTQLDQVTGASTIDPAVEQMKVGSDGTIYNSPDERVRTEHQSVVSQLAQTGQELTTLDNKKLDRTAPIPIGQIDKNSGKIDQTYLSEELLQQMTGDTPVNAVPANYGVTNIKLA